MTDAPRELTAEAVEKVLDDVFKSAGRFHNTRRTYQPWQAWENNLLVMADAMGKTADTLAPALERTPAAVRRQIYTLRQRRAARQR